MFKRRVQVGLRPITFSEKEVSDCHYVPNASHSTSPRIDETRSSAQLLFRGRQRQAAHGSAAGIGGQSRDVEAFNEIPRQELRNFQAGILIVAIRDRAVRGVCSFSRLRDMRSRSSPLARKLVLELKQAVIVETLCEDLSLAAVESCCRLRR